MTNEQIDERIADTKKHLDHGMITRKEYVRIVQELKALKAQN